MTGPAQHATKSLPVLHLEGQITGSNGPLLTARLPLASLGSMVEIASPGQTVIPGIITSLRGDSIVIAPLGETTGIMAGSAVRSSSQSMEVCIDHELDGGIFDALGRSIERDERSPVRLRPLKLKLRAQPPHPLTRIPVSEILSTGISAIDGFTPIGYGQRISLSAPAGAGKSTLLECVARNAQVDHVVIALIGERGREAQEFISAARSQQATIILSTSDEPPIKKVLAAETAVSVAEHFRNQGKRVLLIVDSLTRLARAMRDIGLANGEIPVRQGFPASVLVELPRLLERCGNNNCGSITAIFSLLEEAGHGQDYLTHEIASLLDGHIMLDSALAQRAHYPAIDPLRSLSRLFTRLLPPASQKARATILKMLTRLNRDRELLLLGGEPDPELSRALALEKELNALLTQEKSEVRTVHHSLAAFEHFANKLAY